MHVMSYLVYYLRTIKPLLYILTYPRSQACTPPLYGAKKGGAWECEANTYLYLILWLLLSSDGGCRGGRWDKSLGVLCQKFVMIFLISPVSVPQLVKSAGWLCVAVKLASAWQEYKHSTCNC